MQVFKQTKTKQNVTTPKQTTIPLPTSLRAQPPMFGNMLDQTANWLGDKRGDTKALHGDTKALHGDTKALHGDNKALHGYLLDTCWRHVGDMLETFWPKQMTIQYCPVFVDFCQLRKGTNRYEGDIKALH